MSVYVLNYACTSSSLATITGSTATATLLTQNSNRVKFFLFHSGSSRAYVALSGSGTPTSASCSFQMDNGDYFEERDWKGPVLVSFASNSANTVVYATDLYR